MHMQARQVLGEVKDVKGKLKYGLIGTWDEAMFRHAPGTCMVRLLFYAHVLISLILSVLCLRRKPRLGTGPALAVP
jgi:hypothetical protein